MPSEVINIEDSPEQRNTSTTRPPLETCITLYDSDDSIDLPEPPLLALRRSASEHGTTGTDMPCLSVSADLRSKLAASVLLDDIEFSSTAKTFGTEKKALCKNNTLPDIIGIVSSSQDELPDLEMTVKQPAIITRPIPLIKSHTLPNEVPGALLRHEKPAVAPLSSNILKNIDSLLQPKKSGQSSRINRRPGSTRSRSESHDSADTAEDAEQITKRAKKTRDQEARESAANLKALKQAEREQARIQKALEKERRVVEKRKAQSIAAVNTLKKSKKDSAPEMILEICKSVDRTAFHTHLREFMESLGCSWSLGPMPVNGLVRLRRKISAEYKPELGYWLPLDEPRISDEDQLIVILKGQEFLHIASSSDRLSQHAEAVRRTRPTARVLYLIEGLAALLRKSQAQKNRAYQAAVRAVGETVDIQGTRRSRPEIAVPTGAVDEQVIEDALLDLQVVHRCCIVHATSPADTAEQLSVLVSDLSTVPYKHEREGLTETFCTESGQIKTGTDARDTFEKMLQAIARVTPQIAQAVATKYSNIRELCTALKAGPQILELIPKGHNVDGTVTGQVLGTATSLKIHRALMSHDAHLDA